MFDVGFSEMLVIGIVALVVIGPERLPKVARTLGVLTGRLQRYVAQVKSDIHREMEAAELGKVKTEFENAARSFKTDVETNVARTEQDIREAQAAIERDLSVKADFTPTPLEEPPLETKLADLPPPSPQLELGIDAPSSADRPR